jgi:hypothetical protein
MKQQTKYLAEIVHVAFAKTGEAAMIAYMMSLTGVIVAMIWTLIAVLNL